MVIEELTRTKIVAQARTWLDTPYHHQGRLKGVGVDCIGYLVGVGLECGVDCDRPEWRSYPRVPRDDGILVALREVCGPSVVTWGPGDILCFWMQERRKLPHHLGFATDVGIIHTHGGAGRVVENALNDWWMTRFLAAFTFPGVAPWPH